MTASGPSDVWAVGQWLGGGFPTPNPGGSQGGGGFGGITVAPGGTVWAVDADNTATSANEALIERLVP